MKKIILFFGILSAFLFLPVFVFAQTTEAINLDELLAIALIVAAGIGGYSVNSLTALIKNWLNAHGFWVIVLSIVISAIFVIVYLFFHGWDWLEFLILTTLVTAIANGAHFAKKSRDKK